MHAKSINQKNCNLLFRAAAPFDAKTGLIFGYKQKWALNPLFIPQEVCA